MYAFQRIAIPAMNEGAIEERSKEEWSTISQLAIICLWAITVLHCSGTQNPRPFRRLGQSLTGIVDLERRCECHYDDPKDQLQKLGRQEGQRLES